MTEGNIGSVGVSVVPDATGFWTRFREQTQAGAAEAGRRAGEDWQRGFNSAAGRSTVRVNVDTNKARQDSAGLLSVLLTLSPAVVPLAAAAGLAGAALVSMAAAGTLAVKGIQADLKAANADGIKFSASVNLIKSDLGNLEHTAAHSVLGEFEESASKLHAVMPSLNVDMAQTSRTLGDIVDHLLGGAIGGLHNFAPALEQIAELADKGAARFEAWATGPGGAKFAESLSTDLQRVAPLLGDLTADVGRLVAASNGPGLGIVDELDVLAKILREIPLPVLTALTTGIVSLRIASLVTGLMDKLALSIRGVAVAEGEAAAATGFRTGLAGTVGVLGKVAAGWIAVSVAAGAAQHATQGWAASSDPLKATVGTFNDIVSDALHLNFKGLGDIFSGNSEADKTRSQVIALKDALDDMYASLEQHQKATLFNGAALPGIGATDPRTAAAAAGGALGSGQTAQLTLLQQIELAYRRSIEDTNAALRAQKTALADVAGGSTVSQLQTAYSAGTTALQKHIDATEKFLNLGGEEINTYKGVSISAGTYAAALAKTGGNLEAATGYIEAQIDAQHRSKAALAEELAQQQRLSTFVSDVGTKYKLTGSQVDLYTAALGLNTNAIAASAGGMHAAEAEFGKFVDALREGSPALNAWVAAVGTFVSSARTAVDRAQLLGAALVSFNGDAIGFGNAMVGAATANQQLVTDLKNLHSGVINLKTGFVDYHNAAAGPVLADLANLQQSAMAAAAATYQLEVGHKGAAAAAKDAADVFHNDTTVALEGELQQLGYTKSEADKLANRYFHWPKNAKTQIEALGAKTTNDLLNALGEQLSFLTGHPWKFTVDGDIAPALTKLNTLHQVILADSQGFVVTGSGRQGKADGGWITNGTGPRADDVLIKVSKGEAVIPADRAAKHSALVNDLIYGKYESGGFVGVDYSGGKAATSKDSAFSSTLASFLQSVLGTATNPIVAAFNSMISSLQSSGAKLSSQFVGYLRDENEQLKAAGKERDQLATKLAAAQDKLVSLTQSRSQEIGTVSGAVTGTFDISTAGQNNFGEPATLFDIQTGLGQALGNAKQFEAVIKRLAREGLNRQLVAQLAEAGPAALPQAQALLSATPKQLASINAEFTQLGNIGKSLGTFTANDMYQAGIASARGLVRGLKSQESALNKVMRDLAKSMIDQLKSSLGIHSPSRVMHELGGFTGEGFALGIASKYGAVVGAANRLANGSTPNSQLADWSGGGQPRPAGDVHYEFNVEQHYPTPEPLVRSIPSAIRAATYRLDR